MYDEMLDLLHFRKFEQNAYQQQIKLQSYGCDLLQLIIFNVCHDGTSILYKCTRIVALGGRS